MHYPDLSPIDETSPHDLPHVVSPSRHAKATIGSYLENSLGPSRGLDHRPTFGEEPGHGFLTDHVLAGLHGSNGNEGMPVRRSRNRNHIQVITLQQAPKIRIAGLVVRPAHPLDVTAGYFSDGQLVLTSKIPKCPRAPSSCPDQGRSERLAGRRILRPTKHMGRDYLKHARTRRLFHKRSPVRPGDPRLSLSFS